MSGVQDPPGTAPPGKGRRCRDGINSSRSHQSRAFIVEKASSVGSRSGEYGGRNSSSSQPGPSINPRTRPLVRPEVVHLDHDLPGRERGRVGLPFLREKAEIYGLKLR